MGARSPQRRKPSAKELANLQPNPHTLKRGGKEPRGALSLPELEFCSYIVAGASGADAVRWAGFPGNNPAVKAYDLQKRPLIQSKIAEFREKTEQEVLERTLLRREERSAFLHSELIYRLRKAKTHKYRGDEPIAKLLEVGFKSTREIESTRVTANAGASAAAVNASTTNHLFVPEWKKMQTQNPATTVDAEPLPDAKLESSKPSSV